LWRYIHYQKSSVVLEKKIWKFSYSSGTKNHLLSSTHRLTLLFSKNLWSIWDSHQDMLIPARVVRLVTYMWYNRTYSSWYVDGALSSWRFMTRGKCRFKPVLARFVTHMWYSPWFSSWYVDSALSSWRLMTRETCGLQYVLQDSQWISDHSWCDPWYLNDALSSWRLMTRETCRLPSMCCETRNMSVI